jgi:hypothetical protein
LQGLCLTSVQASGRVLRIFTNFVGTVRKAGNQFKIQMLDDFSNDCSADQPGSPLRYPKNHFSSSQLLFFCTAIFAGNSATVEFQKPEGLGITASAA